MTTEHKPHSDPFDQGGQVTHQHVESNQQRIPHREIREPLGVLHEYAMLAAGVVVSRRNEALAAENEIIERYARLFEQYEDLSKLYEQKIDRVEELSDHKQVARSAHNAAERTIVRLRTERERLKEQLETMRKALDDACDVAIWLSGLPCLRESDAWPYWESDARPRLYKAMALLDSNPASEPSK